MKEYDLRAVNDGLVAAVNDRLTRLMAKVEADPRLVGTTRAIAARVLTEEGGNVGKAFNRLTYTTIRGLQVGHL